MNTPVAPSDIRLDVNPDRAGRYIATAAFGEATIHRDSLDLNSETSRKRFVNGVLKALPELNGSADTFRKDLSTRLLAFANAPPGPAELPPTTRADRPAHGGARRDARRCA